MGVIKRTVKFTAGGITGAVIGGVAALILATESGRDLRQSLRDRLRRAKLAGAEAKAERENELIRKFRAEVNDQEALKEVEAQAREARDQAVVALGLGFNAPGAIAAQEIDRK